MEKLPERWAVERTPENYKEVNEWAKVVIYKGIITNREIFNCTGGYLHSDGAVYKKVCYDYMLLLPSQFMQLVYNPWKQAKNSDGWVKCSERFPERDTEKYIDRSTKKNVWVYEGGDRFDCTVGFYVHLLGYWVNEFGSRIEVTHWRELPAPPKD